MNILLISIKSIWDGGYPAAHLGFYRIASYLKDNGHQCDVVDLEIDDFKPVKIDIANGKYGIIGFSVSNYEMEADLQLLWECKEIVKGISRQCLMVAGGQQATFNAEVWLKAGIDIAILGFGERPMCDLCNSFEVNMGKSIKDIASNVNGVAYFVEKELTWKPSEPLTQEEFDFLNYERMLVADIPYQKYWDYNRSKLKSGNFNKVKFKFKNIRLYTTSHCLGGCGFCSSQHFLGKSQGKTSKICMLSADKIYSLILNLNERFGAESYFFGSDNFITANKAGRNRVKDLCRKILVAKDRGLLPQDTVFHCMARVDSFVDKERSNFNVDVELLDLMRQTGFENISVGAETFSDRLLKVPSVNKRGINEKMSRIVFDAMLEYNLTPQVLLILAIPESTVDELFYTIDVAMEYIKKGIQLGVTNLMYGERGTPVFEDLNLPISYRECKNPYTGEIVKINYHVIPNDPLIRRLDERFEVMTHEEVVRLAPQTPWSHEFAPKFFVAIASFIAVARILERPDLIGKYENELFTIVEENKRSEGK